MTATFISVIVGTTSAGLESRAGMILSSTVTPVGGEAHAGEAGAVLPA